jgi:membrane glycosyltransferase
MAMKMRQSLAELEQEFREEMQLDRNRSQQLWKRATSRSRKRYREREKKRSSMRFWLLVISLIATAMIVTIAMFETLYHLLG